MGKPLTEEQKAHRAALAIKRKHGKELGPLFAEQIPEVDERALLKERRMGWAVGVERTQEAHVQPAVNFLDVSEYRSLVVIARRHLSAPHVETLDAYCRRTYPDVHFWRTFWLDVLSGVKRVPGTIRLGFDPSKANRYNPDGRFLIEEDFLPPEGWQAPYDRTWREGYVWRECGGCRRWHAPGQVECYSGGAEMTPPPAELIVILAPKPNPTETPP